MRRLAAFLLLAFPVCVSAGPVRVTTWNLHDFPSGQYNLRVPEREPAIIGRAADTIRRQDPDVVLLQEVRDMDSCLRLVEALRPEQYHVLACSEFRDSAGVPGFQQVAILAKRPALEAHWERWKTYGTVDPPRGFAYAVIVFAEVRMAFYSLHLKSNLIQGPNRSRQEQLNILKREIAAEQVVTHSRALMEGSNAVSVVVVGGDFNTSPDDPAFVSENTLATFQSVGFTNGFEDIAQEQRITHPAKAPYPDQTFDYILFRNAIQVGTPVIERSDLSDHYPVTCVISNGSR